MADQVSLEEASKIEALVYDSGHCIDDDRLEDWAELFVEDCICKVTTRESIDQDLSVGVIYCEGRDMVRDRVLAIRQANIFNPHYDRHLITGVRVNNCVEGIFPVQSSYMVMQSTLEGETRIYSAGKYLDKVIIENGYAKFKERIVIADTGAVDNLMAIPL